MADGGRSLRPVVTTVAVAVVGFAVVLAARSASEDPGGDEPGPVELVTGEVLVSAAASLSDAFRAVEADFEAAYPAADVVLNLAGSATLAEQVAGGAPVDVLAVADERILLELADEQLLATPPVAFASTVLVLAYPADNPGGVEGVTDLADEELFLGVCAAQQPCGAYAREALALAGLDADQLADTVEPDARALLAKIVSGELDAGIVYASDLLSAGELEAVTIDGPTATYAAAVVADAPNPVAAEAFVEFLTGPTGAAALDAAAFDVPSPAP